MYFYLEGQRKESRRSASSLEPGRSVRALEKGRAEGISALLGAPPCAPAPLLGTSFRSRDDRAASAGQGGELAGPCDNPVTPSFRIPSPGAGAFASLTTKSAHNLRIGASAWVGPARV